MANNLTRFHILIDDKLKNELTEYSKKCNKSFSETVHKILVLTSHLIERKSFDFFKIDLPKEPRLDNEAYIVIKSYFKNVFYKIQGNFCVRSKAMILRYILRYFMDNLAKYEWGKLYKFSFRTKKNWENIKFTIGVWSTSKTHIGKPYIGYHFTRDLIQLKATLTPRS